MDKERFLQSGLLEQYVLGLTNDKESAEVERYARAFPEIRSEIDLLRNAVQQYAKEQVGTPHLSEPASGALNAPSNGRSDQLKKPSGSTLSRWAMAVCLVLFAGFGFYYFSEAKSSEAEIAQLNDSYLTLKTDCEKEQRKTQALQKQVAFYQHDQTRPVQLKGTELAPDSEVRVFWNDQESSALLQVFFLPDQPETKQYQIWADIEGEMVNLGVIDTRRATPQTIRCFPHASSLNITLEPHGGSDKPHVDQLYANVTLP